METVKMIDNIEIADEELYEGVTSIERDGDINGCSYRLIECDNKNCLKETIDNYEAEGWRLLRFVKNKDGFTLLFGARIKDE